jgi:tetratricopeptide (TPR) repeat protein
LRSSFTIELADIMGQMFLHLPFLMSQTGGFVLMAALLLSPEVFGQASKPALPSADRAIKLAQHGHCEEAVPALKRASQTAPEKSTKRTAAFAGVRCAMLINQTGAAVDFLQMLNREFPGDPEVLYVSVHTYSDLSTRAAQQLAATAPNSVEGHKLDAEALEAQGKWDAAEKEYRQVLAQNPHLPGIHFLLGRLLLSKTDASSTAGEEAKKEFQEELKIDPSNAGAEYVLGEMARQNSQWPEAIQHFSRATELDAGFGDAFLGLGTTLLSAKRYAEAIPPLQTAVKLEPRNPGAHYSLATALIRAGRKEEAEKEFAIHRQMTQKGEAGQQAPAQPQDPN